MTVLKTILSVSIILLFLFLRFYKIQNSLFFFNDMGRDMLVLYTWQETGKPPLLGPQTSALPFNQSAIYFYILFPFYLLTNASPYTALIANAFLYISSFIFSLYFFRNNPKSSFLLLVSFFLISVHPQFIIQNRYIWNPSFVTPFLLPSLLSFYLLSQKYSKIYLWLFSFSLSMALSLSYSIAPLFIALIVTSLFIFKQKIISILFSLGTSLAIINLPTIFFEFRHQFLLTTALLTKHSPPQADTEFLSKLNNLLTFTVGSSSYLLNLIILILIITTSLFFIFKSKSHFQKLISILLLITLAFTFLIPITIQAHYIFGILILFFLLLASVPFPYSLLILITSSLIYFQPSHLNSYFKTAPRTITQTNQCFQQFCQKYPKPLFVTVTSSLHPYHYGPEFRYLMAKNGCLVRNIESQPSSANTMAVVLDSATFSQKTHYYELDLFGPFSLGSTFPCAPNLGIQLITRSNNSIP